MCVIGYSLEMDATGTVPRWRLALLVLVDPEQARTHAAVTHITYHNIYSQFQSCIMQNLELHICPSPRLSRLCCVNHELSFVVSQAPKCGNVVIARATVEYLEVVSATPQVLFGWNRFFFYPIKSPIRLCRVMCVCVCVCVRAR